MSCSAFTSPERVEHRQIHSADANTVTNRTVVRLIGVTILLLAPLAAVVAATLYLLAKDFMALAEPRAAERTFSAEEPTSRLASAERAQQKAFDVIGRETLARRMQSRMDERDGRVDVLVDEVA